MTPWLERGPRGVYGVLFNFAGGLAALGDAVHAPPYVMPPQAPVLYVKPANTWSRTGAAIHLPDGETQVEAGGTIGIVMRHAASRVTEAAALGHVAGLVAVNDWSLSHASFHRPAIRERCRDGFCTLGYRLLGIRSCHDLARITVRTFVNGFLRQEVDTGKLVRSVPQLVSDISEFMTLERDDVILVGVAPDPPRAGPGDVVCVDVEGVGRLENTVIADDSASRPHPSAAWARA